MGSWNCCSICYHPARIPYCCPNGDVFCKECILECLLSHPSAAKIKEKETNEKDINLFLQTQKIAPIEDNPVEQQEKAIPVKPQKKRVKVRCPACKKRIKWNMMLPLSYAENSEGPICCGCQGALIGSCRAERLPCSHVICSECYNHMVSIDKQCPKCGQKFNSPDEAILLNKTVLEKIGSDGCISIKAAAMIAPFG
ncbi:nitric oxide synthase-interacting protein [Histomonas meleagridis]|uniref:nitric oxide synthase-interacting protein n=1 Tax=Histomonas meleagridis TaxID=135588 RepID=UPI003559BBA3|nr:nitric oxide synthase-interacting protein [Histomonas meleagridis]KAH0806786.1 nitric oxide synthase-interacting protein [Histomonas meleagridis]